jgi:cell wall-associated NlpC family hydrolase
LTYERVDDPARTVVHGAGGTALATFTDNARTVRLTGPKRTFAEPAFTEATVTTDAWIRLAPAPWHAGAENESWFRPWFTAALADRSADALAVAVEYLHGAPDKTDANGVRYAGDASFGPVSATDPDGRAENNDFYDYLGITWKFPDAGTVQPKRDRYGDVDCSGFLRLVYGYRLGYPLRGTNEPGDGLPRRAYAISSIGPGAVVVENRGTPARDYARLQPGDLVFFHTEGDSRRTDHSGIFLGVDDTGHYRFISSRSKADGPTFGDKGGEALLDGGGYWSVRFRTARRI